MNGSRSTKTHINWIECKQRLVQIAYNHIVYAYGSNQYLLAFVKKTNKEIKTNSIELLWFSFKTLFYILGSSDSFPFERIDFKSFWLIDSERKKAIKYCTSMWSMKLTFNCCRSNEKYGSALSTHIVSRVLLRFSRQFYYYCFVRVQLSSFCHCQTNFTGWVHFFSSLLLHHHKYFRHSIRKKKRRNIQVVSIYIFIETHISKNEMSKCW